MNVQQPSQQSKRRQKRFSRRHIIAISIVSFISLLLIALIVWILLTQNVTQGAPLVGLLASVVTIVLGPTSIFIWILESSKQSSEQQHDAHAQHQQISESLASSSTTLDLPLILETPMQATQSASVDTLDSALSLNQTIIKIKCSHISAPPGRVFDREEILSTIHDYLLNREIRGVCLCGVRGCGKSLIAKKIAEDCMDTGSPLGKRFTHIVWLTFRKEEFTTTRIEKLYNYQSKYEIYSEILQVHGQPFLGNKDPLGGVREVLRNAPTLVILDSFEFFLEKSHLDEDGKLDRDVADLLKEIAVGSFFLLTSWLKSEEIEEDYKYEMLEVKPFNTIVAKEYFLDRCQKKSILLPKEEWNERVHEDLYKATAGIPLALDLASNYLRTVGNVTAALADLKLRGQHLWEYIYKRMLKDLQGDERYLLMMIMLFKSPLDERRLREATARRFNEKTDEKSFERALQQLRNYGLFDKSDDGFYLHETLREFIMSDKFIKSDVENSKLMKESQQDFIEWTVRIAEANAEWEVDSKQANKLAEDLNNLIAALELLLSGEITQERTLCFFGTTVAHFLHIIGRWTESVKFLEGLLGKMSENACKIKVQVLLGRHYAHQENIAMAEEYLQPALKEAEAIEDETLQAEVYLRLGQTFHRTDPQKASNYLEKALEKTQNKEVRESNDDILKTRVSTLSYMAEIQIQDGKGKEALEILEEADKDLTRLGWDRVRAHHARLKADAYLLIDEKAIARRFYSESIRLSENRADGRLLAWNYLGLAELDRNLKYARKAQVLFETLGLNSQLQRARTFITALNRDAAHLKLHILSEGVSFDAAFLDHFAHDFSSMEKRRAYDDSDERQLDRTKRIPQEMYLNDVVVAVNYKHNSPWHLVYRDNTYHLVHKDGVNVEVTFPQRPRFFDYATPQGIRCDRVANLYGGSSLAFFTPATCYYFKDGHECRFCSLKPNRSSQQIFVHTISPALAASVLEIALETDADLLKQIMLVGGNVPNYDRGFQRHLEIAAALDERQSLLPVERRLQSHIATMPPRDFGLFAVLNELNARVSMNIEVFNEQLFESICPGKANLYGRHRLLQALEYAASIVSGKRVHSILIAGLEPVESTIAGINFLANIGVTPIINVFHNDHGSHYENHPRPSYEDLLEIAYALQAVYKEYNLTPYWKGCGRNALDFEAQQGWFA